MEQRAYYFIHRPSDSRVVGYSPLPQNENPFLKFNKKHSNSGFMYHTQGGFGHSEYINGIFAYQENDILFEFFTGRKLGRIQSNAKVPADASVIMLVGYEFPDLPLVINDGRINDYDYGTILTASQFAHDVKYHMGEKRQITKMMNKYLDICRRAVQIGNTYRKQLETQNNNRNNCNAEWVDSILDNRKS